MRLNFFWVILEQLADFIWSTLLDPIAYRAHCLKNTIERQLEEDLTRRKSSSAIYYNKHN